MKYCIFGGQYGSEGKGSVSEFLIKSRKHPAKLLIAAGENSPNSGHTCAAGKTRNVPAAGFYADAILLGPDSVIDFNILCADIIMINQVRSEITGGKGRPIDVCIHENAAMIHPDDARAELSVVCRISSTGSGSGIARSAKYFDRLVNRTIGYYFKKCERDCDKFRIRVLNRQQYLAFLDQHVTDDWVFECSQGVLLDTNWGIYPYVTSRTTLPQVALERNGFQRDQFTMVGVYRTFPIRTGGPSGPTGGEELTFESIDQPAEIATVTKRTRRLFRFDSGDFAISVRIAKPDVLAFTHVDYLKVSSPKDEKFYRWLEFGVMDHLVEGQVIIASCHPGSFRGVINHHSQEWMKGHNI